LHLVGELFEEDYNRPDQEHSTTVTTIRR